MLDVATMATTRARENSTRVGVRYCTTSASVQAGWGWDVLSKERMYMLHYVLWTLPRELEPGRGLRREREGVRDIVRVISKATGGITME